MDSKNLISILQDALEDQMPASQINLLPAVQARLVARNTSLLQQGEKMKKIRYRKLVFSAIVLIALLAVTLITPQGRAFAQTLFRFFTPAKSESFPLSEEQVAMFNVTPTPAPNFALALETVSSPNNNEPVEATAVPLSTSSSATDVLKNCKATSDLSSYACQIALAELQLGFDAREFPTIPHGLTFIDAQSNTTLHLLTINYSVVEGGGSLTFTQGEGIIPTSDWDEVPADAIQQVKVNGNYGEFAQGQFVVYPGATSATWNADAAVVRLRWSDGSRRYSLEKMGNIAPIDYMDKQFLINLAGSLVKSPSHQANTSLASGYYSSISEAESSMGVDLLEPHILPEGFKFAYARYDASEQSIMLFYGVGGLHIMETPRHISSENISCEECPAGTVEQIEINSELAYYWQGSFYTGTDKEPLPTPIWQPDDPHYTLTWMTPDLIITLLYDGQISKDDLVKIVESMR